MNTISWHVFDLYEWSIRVVAQDFAFAEVGEGADRGESVCHVVQPRSTFLFGGALT